MGLKKLFSKDSHKGNEKEIKANEKAIKANDRRTSIRSTVSFSKWSNKDSKSDKYRSLPPFPSQHRSHKMDSNGINDSQDTLSSIEHNVKASQQSSFSTQSTSVSNSTSSLADDGQYHSYGINDMITPYYQREKKIGECEIEEMTHVSSDDLYRGEPKHSHLSGINSIAVNKQNTTYHDSIKYQAEEDDRFEDALLFTDANSDTQVEDDSTLHSRLVSVQQQLSTITPHNITATQLNVINKHLKTALNSSLQQEADKKYSEQILTQKSNELQSLTQKYEHATTQTQQLEQRLSEHNQLYHAIEEVVTIRGDLSLKERIQAMSKSMTTLTDSNHKLQSKLTRLEEEIKEKIELQREVGSLKQDLNRAYEELEKERYSHLQKEKEFEQYRADMNHAMTTKENEYQLQSELTRDSEEKYAELILKHDSSSKEHKSQVMELNNKYESIIHAKDALLETLQSNYAQERTEYETSSTEARDLLHKERLSHKQEKDELLAEIDFVKTANLLETHQLMEENERLNETMEAMKKKLSELTKMNADIMSELETVQGQLQSIEKVNGELNEIQTLSDRSAKAIQTAMDEANDLNSALKSSEDKLYMALNEIKQLKEEMKSIQDISKQSTLTIMSENEQLKKQCEQLMTQSEQLKNQSKQLTLIQKNHDQLRGELTKMKQVQDENVELQALVTSLQSQINSTNTANNEIAVNDCVQQEELMRMHTRAQLVLIEFLEGEDDVTQALARFKKQLESEMMEFDANDAHIPL